jgi:tetratricopeptide (TPR) repeat protein
MELAVAVVSWVILFAVRLALGKFFRRVGLGEGLLWLMVGFIAAVMAVGLLDPKRTKYIDECRQEGGGYWDCQRSFGRARPAIYPDAEPSQLAAYLLARKGTLRVGISFDNVLLAPHDVTTGVVARGVPADLAQELGRWLGVPIEIVPFASTEAMAGTAKTGEWSVAFFEAEPQRKEIFFSTAYAEIDSTYLVRADSQLRTIADLDRPGVRIAVAEKSACDIYLGRSLKQAQIVRAPGAGAYELFVSQKLEALAGLRPALIAHAEKDPGLRVLEGRFGTVPQVIGTPNDEAAIHLRQFTEHAKASGLVARLIENNPVSGLSSAPVGVHPQGRIDPGPAREAPRPDDKAAAYNKSGDAWFGKFDWDRAIADYSEAIRLDPRHAGAYKNRAVAWVAKGDYQRALADFDEVLRLNPEDVDAYYKRGLTWQNRRDYDRAIADYSEVLRRDPKSPGVYQKRGSALQAKGEYERAIADYSDALRVDPTNTDAYNSAARLLATAPVASVRDGARAVELATRAAELMQWANADYLDTLAAAHAEAGNFAEAVRWQQKALADRHFAREHGEEARARLELYRKNQPYRLNPK